MSPQRIQRKRTKGWRVPENTTYVGRGSKWGNPWAVDKIERPGAPTIWNVRSRHHGASMGEFVKQDEAIRWAIVGFKSQYLPDMDLANLCGKNLACWCPLDQPCHADVLLELANS